MTSGPRFLRSTGFDVARVFKWRGILRTETIRSNQDAEASFRTKDVSTTVVLNHHIARLFVAQGFTLGIGRNRADKHH
jgi:hypothetical protein